jgi:hypothetical protein
MRDGRAISTELLQVSSAVKSAEVDAQVQAIRADVELLFLEYGQRRGRGCGDDAAGNAGDIVAADARERFARLTRHTRSVVHDAAGGGVAVRAAHAHARRSDCAETEQNVRCWP